MYEHDQIRQYGTIEKTEQRPDGLMVIGVASSEATDLQGEVVKASAMRKALRGYFTKGPGGEISGPVREMHQMSAVGKALAAEVDSEGRTHVETLIVDPVAIAKVRSGVYKGFSIGGRVPPGGRNTSNPAIIERLILTEISLVDRPSNPEATIALMKADALAKVAAERDGALAKVETLRSTLRKVQGERDALRADRDRLAKVARARAAEAGTLREALDAAIARAPKGALRAVPISKGEDTGGLVPEAPPEPDDAFALIKAAHRSPAAIRPKVDG